MAKDLLLEIGVEELPASFVSAALAELPGLVTKHLAAARVGHGGVTACGTPRRLAVIAQDVCEAQDDIDEDVVGPPVRVAFDADGRPTRAAEKFAEKLGCTVGDLSTRDTPKGGYLVGRRVERGAPTRKLLPDHLRAICREIHFRKSMRWSDGDTTFGRPIRWLVALFGEEALDLELAGVSSGRESRGHRFLCPEAIPIGSPSQYVDTLRAKHVLVLPDERTSILLERLRAAAKSVGGVLIEDPHLVDENASLVEEPQVIVGGFDDSFLALPEQVILAVARGHQRYFGARAPGGSLLPRYLAVANTALEPEKIRSGNDRVMRARLADAKFFYDEDLKTPLGSRRAELGKVVFQRRLGSVGDKVTRLERLVRALGEHVALAAGSIDRAREGAALCKCDLTTLMVGELPELQGEVGRSYALAQGIDPAVADVIAEHYAPRGAQEEVAASDAGALVALSDRIDTLVGCFAVGLVPSGAADPLALRRAAIGLLRTALRKSWDVSLEHAVRAAHAGYAEGSLDLDADGTVDRLAPFLRQRLRGLLVDDLPSDVVDACLDADADRPRDLVLRAQALAGIDPAVRATAGEVFKRAVNIAKDAPEGEPRSPSSLRREVHSSEQKLFDGLMELRDHLRSDRDAGDYAAALSRVAAFAPTVAQFFDDVFVMVEDTTLRENRLRLMRAIHRLCSELASFNLLAVGDDRRK